MKKFILLILIVALPGSAFAEGLLDDKDKQAHAGVSAVLTVFTHAALRNRRFNKWEAMITSAALVGFLGVAKEVGDSRANGRDLAADGAGIGIGLCLTFLIDWY